jgi:signal transduction histidine kinase
MSASKASELPPNPPTRPMNWSPKRPHGHVVQFYSNDEFLIGSLSRLIGSALGAGDAAIAVATPEHRAALAGNLSSRGLDVASIAQQGRYVALDASETLSKFMLDGRPDPVLFEEVISGLVERTKAKAGGKDARLCVFGEMVALLWTQGQTEAAVRLEQLWNDLGSEHSFALYCAYPISGFAREDHSELFLKICREHPGLIPGESHAGLATEDDRLRNIVHLQQRAQALECEIAGRRRVERELKAARDELEKRVAERTLELREKNRQILEQAETLARTNEGLRQLSARLLRVQDEERRRIARDLHDSTGQVLALLGMNLAALQTEARRVSPEIAGAVAENARLVSQVSDELRTISYLLHPPLLDELGLKSALRWFVGGFAQRSGIKVSLSLDRGFGRLSPDLETTIFRVVQECLTNIHRHSGSPTAAIRLYRSPDRLRLQIEDAGKGIAAQKFTEIASFGATGVGLRGMRERIKDFDGELEIASGENGTQVQVSIPLDAAAPTPVLFELQ